MTDNERVFAILTVIPETDAAIRRLFNLTERKSVRPRAYYHGQLPTTQGTVRVVTSRCDARSNIPACMAAAAFLADWKPDYLLVVDIAGGIFRTGSTPPPTDEVVQLGDVVVHDKLIYYEFRKLTSDDDRERSFPFQNPGPSLWHAALQVQRSQPVEPWWSHIGVERPPSSISQAKILFGDILCGDKLLGDPESTLVRELVESYDKAIAVDMESVGVARAIHDMQPRMQKAVEFIAIRGISDYCNVVNQDENNQSTRERWRRYAAEAAAAVAFQVIREEGEVQRPAETLRRYQIALSDALATLPAPEQSFALSIRDKKTGENEYAAAVDLVRVTGRAVLQGKAGAGKTAALNSLARSAAELGYLPVLLNLRKLQPAELSHVMDPGVPLAVQVDALLATSLSPISYAMLGNLPEDTHLLFLADGVNELFGENQIARIFATLDAYVDSRGASVSVLITDRPANTTLPAQWQVAILHGVRVDFLDTLLTESGAPATLTDAERKILQLPFYLNWAVEHQDFRLGSAAEIHERFFLEQLQLGNPELDVLAEGALDAYVTARSPEFNFQRFRQRVKNDLAARLTKAAVIRRVDSATAQFDHQLRHDYLAARQIARHRETWVAKCFDALTFEAASTPTLDLVIGQLDNEIEGDAFIRAVYDWSWGAATRCVTEAARHVPRVCSPEIEVAISCLIAEKQFDPVAHTSASSRAAMQGFRAGLGSEVAKLTSREEVWAFPQRVQSSSAWFNDWRHMFGGSANKEVLLAAIAGPQSLVGWTAASVIRRQADPPLLASLIDTYVKSADAHAVRWRVVHALGRFDAPAAVQLLMRAVDSDRDDWVQYGAGRSLVEIAATTGEPTRRDEIVALLVQRMRALPDKVIEEVARTVLYAGTDSGWKTAALPLVDEAQQRVSTDLRKKKLQEVAAALTQQDFTRGSE